MFVFSPIFRIYVVTFLPFKVQIIDIKRFTNTQNVQILKIYIVMQKIFLISVRIYSVAHI